MISGIFGRISNSYIFIFVYVAPGQHFVVCIKFVMSAKINVETKDYFAGSILDAFIIFNYNVILKLNSKLFVELKL